MSALRPILLGASILTSSVLLAAPAQAQSAAAARQTVEFNIPAQNLGTALNELGRQAGVSIAFPFDAVSGRRSVALRGSFRPADAARQLLAGTGLRVTERGSALVVQREEPRPTSSSNDTAPSPIATAASADEDIIVTGPLSGVATSIARQKDATTVKNVVSSDDFAKLPDFNAAEALRRLPGISMVEDHGEGRFVSIRGARPNYNGTMFNGFTVPTADSESHRVDLQTIPNSLIERIEVNKTMTPDLPGEGIGGSINIVARNPADIKRLTGGVSVYGGIQQYEGKEFRADGFIADRFGADGQFGFSLTGSYRQNERETYISEPEDWQLVPASGGGEVWAPSEIGQTTGEFKQRNIGVDAAFGGSFDTMRFQVRGFYSLSNLPGTEDMLIQELEPAEDDGDVIDFGENGGLVGGEITRRFSYKEWNLALYGVQSTMDADLGGGWQLDMGHSFQQAREHYPDRLDIRGTSVEIDDPLPMQIALDRASLGPFDGAIPGPLQPAAIGVTFAQDGGRFDDQGEHTAYANLRKDFELGGGNLELKGGTYLRFIDQSSDNVASRWTVLPGQTVSFAEFMPEGKSMVRDGIFFGSLSRLKQAKSLVERNASKFGPNQVFYVRGIDISADFRAKVNIQAYYGMATYRNGPFTLIGGGRYEIADTSFERLGEEAGSPPQTFSGTSEHFLPSVHLRYDITPELIARASWSNTTSRPDPENVYANESRDDIALTIVRPNPGLKPLTSENLDASLDWYFGPLSYVSVGGFTKSIDNYPLVTQDTVTIDGQLYDQFTTQAGASGKIEGFEAAFRHQFDKLPGLLGGFGIELNYAHINSTLIFEPRPDKPPLSEQPENIFNGALVYAKGPLFARLSLSYTGDSIDDGGMSDDGPDYDEIIDDRTTLDLSASYNVSDRFQLFAEWRNITNSTAITYSGARSRLISWESFGTTGGLGLRLRY